MKADVRIRMGRRRPLPLRVPGEIFDVYQPLMGAQATLLWLNMRWLEHAQVDGDIEEALQARLDLPFAKLTKPLDELVRFGLLEIGASGEYILHEPLSAEAFATHCGDLTAVAEAEQAEAEVAATTAPEAAVAVQVSTQRKRHPVEGNQADVEHPDAAVVKTEEVKPWCGGQENLSADMEAVMDLYHRKIGMAGPTQFDKLRFWVEEQGMEGEVVAAAIEETVQSAQTPRINYLEGILRNWSNDGIRTLKDLVEKKASKVLSGAGARGLGQGSGAQGSMEGMANAAAYQRVDPKLVKKWKELYPDEYDG